MENNNYKEENNSMNSTGNTDNRNGMGTSAGAGNGQQENSTYRYSYMDQEQKNPNNIWRADDNTSGAGTGSAYTDQAGTYNHYSNAGTGSSQNAYSTQQGANSTYGTQGGSAYGSAQTNSFGQSSSSYSDIYGTQSSQGGYQSYQSDKAQKKEERARKRAEKRTGSSSNFGIKIAKCASIALVFGLVAGTTFEGSSYLMGNLFGTNHEQAEITEDKDREVLNTPDNTDNLPLQQTSTANSDGVVAIVKQCMPSIVSITNLSQVQIQNFFGQVQSYEVPSAGSGILVSEDEDYLYIATNNHVVASTSENTLTIQFCDDTTATAEVKGTDKSTDLAVVQVKKSDVEADTLSAIKVATFGDSDKMEVGSQAIAIGNALGYGQSVTAGYVSAMEREVTMQDETTGESFTNNLIQTDAAINPGNSGGALLNSSGEVIGINSSKYSDTDVEGMGFAIPSNMAKPIIEDLITKEAVTGDKAAYLGITGKNVPSSMKAYNMPEGVFVQEVGEGTAAEQYGLKVGDIITKFDGKEVKNMQTLVQRLSYCEAGTEVEIVVQRAAEGDFEEKTLKVVLGQKNS